MFTMHLLGAIPNAGKYLEFSIEGSDYYPWQDGLFRNDPYTITRRQGDDPERARLGHRDRPGLARTRRLSGQRCGLKGRQSGMAAF